MKKEKILMYPMVFGNRRYWCELVVFNILVEIEITVNVTNDNKYNGVCTCPFHSLFNGHDFCSFVLFVGDFTV